MPKPFDPYHKWLGISREEQPPNYYRLLGVSLFERDPDVIEHAADQRMTHLRTLQAGEHASMVHQLLNKISVAKHCLLNKELREKYNQTLHEQHKRPEPKVAPPLPAGVPGRTKLDKPPIIKKQTEIMVFEIDESAVVTPTTKPCPFCGETILAVARKCKHCGEFLDIPQQQVQQVLPVARTSNVPEGHVTRRRKKKKTDCQKDG